MDRYELGGMLGLLILVIAFVLVFVPVMGEVMHYIITNWFGHAIDDNLYWTGVGLLAVFTLVFSIKSEKDD